MHSRPARTNREEKGPGAKPATTTHPGLTPKAAKKGIKTNRVKARQHARAIYAEMQRLKCDEGLTAFAALAARLEELGHTGTRGGRITRERLYEIRQRLKNS
jgi:hypothetical protein